MTTSILILNDRPVICEGLTTVLDRVEDFKVVTSGPSSLNVRELVQRLQPDVLMLDLQSLGSIFQIANDAKESKPGLKLILTTSSPLPEDKRQAERIAAKGVVSIMNETEVLIEAIKTETSDIHVEPYENHLRVRFRQQPQQRYMCPNRHQDTAF